MVERVHMKVSGRYFEYLLQCKKIIHTYGVFTILNAVSVRQIVR